MSNVVDYLSKAKRVDIMQILIDIATRSVIRLRNVVDSSLEAVFTQLYHICVRLANVKSIQDQISYLLSLVLPLVTSLGYRKVQWDVCILLHYCFLRPTSNVLCLLINFFSFFEFDDNLSSLNSIRLPESQNCKFRQFLVDWIFNFSLNNDENSLNFVKDVSPILFCQLLEQILLRKPCNMRTFDDVHEISCDHNELETDLCHHLGIIDEDVESVLETNAVHDYVREKEVESAIFHNFQRFYNEYFNINKGQVTESGILPCFCAITFFLSNRRKIDQENISQTVDWLKLISYAKSSAAMYMVLLHIKRVLKSIVSNWKISNAVIEFVHKIAFYSESPIFDIFVSEGSVTPILFRCLFCVQ
uniref:Uncharacterized protein n=1 Tax=Romanomermis culicivorax TaxID=13658 RepID=A0A915ILI6_ROMCU